MQHQQEPEDYLTLEDIEHEQFDILSLLSEKRAIKIYEPKEQRKNIIIALICCPFLIFIGIMAVREPYEDIWDHYLAWAILLGFSGMTLAVLYTLLCPGPVAYAYRNGISWIKKGRAEFSAWSDLKKIRQGYSSMIFELENGTKYKLLPDLEKYTVFFLLLQDLVWYRKKYGNRSKEHFSEEVVAEVEHGGLHLGRETAIVAREDALSLYKTIILIGLGISLLLIPIVYISGRLDHLLKAVFVVAFGLGVPIFLYLREKMDRSHQSVSTLHVRPSGIEVSEADGNLIKIVWSDIGGLMATEDMYQILDREEKILCEYNGYTDGSFLFWSVFGDLMIHFQGGELLEDQ